MIDIFVAHGFTEITRKCDYGDGVYVLFDDRGEAVYVGQGNVGSRVRDHAAPRSRIKWERAVAIYLGWFAGRDQRALEAALIRLLKPRHNISRGAFRRNANHPVLQALAQPVLPLMEAA